MYYPVAYQPQPAAFRLFRRRQSPAPGTVYVYPGGASPAPAPSGGNGAPNRAAIDAYYARGGGIVARPDVYAPAVAVPGTQGKVNAMFEDSRLDRIERALYDLARRYNQAPAGYIAEPDFDTGSRGARVDGSLFKGGMGLLTTPVAIADNQAAQQAVATAAYPAATQGLISGTTLTRLGVYITPGTAAGGNLANEAQKARFTILANDKPLWRADDVPLRRIQDSIFGPDQFLRVNLDIPADTPITYQVDVTSNLTGVSGQTSEVTFWGDFEAS